MGWEANFSLIACFAYFRYWIFFFGWKPSLLTCIYGCAGKPLVESLEEPFHIVFLHIRRCEVVECLDVIVAERLFLAINWLMYLSHDYPRCFLIYPAAQGQKYWALPAPPPRRCYCCCCRYSCCVLRWWWWCVQLIMYAATKIIIIIIITGNNNNNSVAN